MSNFEFKNFLTKNWRILILIIFSVAFFFIYSWFPYQTSKPLKFSSPDATANYFWAERVSGSTANGAVKPHYEGTLTYFEPLNVVADDVVIPRSVRSDNGTVKPVSFLGIILIYGLISKIFGSWIIIYLTPLFAAIGVLFFYGIIKKIFNSKIAFISALLLLPFAPYWYYASRSMFHNVLFVDLILIGVWFLILHRDVIKKNVKQDGDAAVPRLYALAIPFLSGIFFGLAIMTRVSELIWLVPAILLGGTIFFKQVKLDKLISRPRLVSLSLIFLCGIFLALLPMFYYNQILYGGFLNFGYSQPGTVEVQNEIVVDPENINGISVFTGMTQKFLPFGFHPRAAWNNFVNYFVKMYWYLFWPALIGGLLFLYKHKERDKKQWLYFVIFCTTSIILVSFYGSWAIQDNINPRSITIGNSYTRYWLPMYIMAIPLAIMAWQKLSELFKNKYFKEIIIYWFVILFFILNIQSAVFAEEEGLLIMRDNIIKDRGLAENVLTQIESEAIIINQHFDKYFWPEHKVIVDNLNNEDYYSIYTDLISRGLPLYYYGFIFREDALNHLNNERLNKYSLRLDIIELDEENKLGLYKLTKEK